MKTHPEIENILRLFLTVNGHLSFTAVVIEHYTPTGPYVQTVYQVHVLFVSFQSPEVSQPSFLIILFVALGVKLKILSLYVHFNYCALTFQVIVTNCTTMSESMEKDKQLIR